MTTEDIIIHIFCWVDDQMGDVKKYLKPICIRVKG